MRYNMDDDFGAYWDDNSTELDSGMNNDSYYSMDTDSMGQDLGNYQPQQFSFGDSLQTDWNNPDGISSLFNMGNQWSPDINQQQTDYNFPGYSAPDLGNQGASGNDINWMGALSKIMGGSGPGQTKQIGNPNAGSQDMLTKILSSLGGLKGMFGLGSALMTGQQNKQSADNTNRIVQQQQARQDPFASQRPFYQQQLQQSVTSPYSSPIVADQLKAMQALQARKDAAAGRRSNTAGSNPALMAEAAKVALQDRNSLMQPAGANINPNQIGLQDLLGASQLQTQGTMSPLMSAIGKILQGNEIQDRQSSVGNSESTMDNLLKVLSRLSGS
jgi:hypothetical protein